MAKKTTLLKYLNQLEKEDLIAEIEKLCQKFEVVKKYFDIEVNGDTSRYVNAAKREIERQFVTATGSLRRNPKASNLNAIIKDFERLSIYKEDVIELMIFRVEQTMDYAKSARNISEALFSSTTTVIGRVKQQIADEQLGDRFAIRIEPFDNRWWRYGMAKDWEPTTYY